MIVNVNEKPLPYGTFYFVFSSFIQKFNAKDSWKPNHNGEDPKLLCDKRDSAPDFCDVPRHEAHCGGTWPSHSSNIRLHPDSIQNSRPAKLPGAGLQKPEPGHCGHVLERHTDRPVRVAPWKLAALLPSGSDPLCERGASYHRPSGGAGSGARLPWVKTHCHWQTLLFQPHQGLPLP